MRKPPIKNFVLAKYPNGSVTQWFAENPALYAHLKLAGHNGIDIVAPHGTPMFAVEDATVVNVKTDAGGYGKHVRLISKNKDKYGFNNEWTYGHCDTIQVKVGDLVHAGEQIATMGNTGFVVSGSTPYWKYNPFAGTHLHLGLREVKLVRIGGWSYPDSDIKMVTQNYDNGYKGAIDPYPWLGGLTEGQTDYRKLQLTVVSLLNKLIGLIK